MEESEASFINVTKDIELIVMLAKGRLTVMIIFKPNNMQLSSCGRYTLLECFMFVMQKTKDQLNTEDK